MFGAWFECYDCRHYDADTNGGGGIGGYGKCPWRPNGTHADSGICAFFADARERA